MAWNVFARMGASGLSLAGLGPKPPPHLHSPGFPRCTDKLHSDPACKVLTYNQLLSFGQKSPKVPISQGQELEESLVFPLGGLGVGVGDRPLANPSAPQPSTGVSVMMTSGAGSWGWEGESCCSEACLPPNRGSAPSYPVACYSACNPTIRVMSFGLRQ